MLTFNDIQASSALPKERQSEIHKEFARGVMERGGLKPYFEFRGRQECIRKAMAKPLPGNSADAFLNGCLKVNERTIYEVMPVHIKALQKVDSPLLRAIEQMQVAAREALAKGEKSAEVKTQYEEEDLWNLCYIFTTPPRELRKQIKTGGAAEIIKSAEVAWGGASASEIDITYRAIEIQYARHFQTTVKFASELEQSGDTRFFQEQTESH